MKIIPVILCGGAGTRLWDQSKENLPKQFIDWGGWTLFGKTLERVKNPIFEYPIITTNFNYLNLVKKYLSKHKAIILVKDVSRKHGHLFKVLVTQDSRKTSSPSAFGSM